MAQQRAKISFHGKSTTQAQKPRDGIQNDVNTDQIIMTAIMMPLSKDVGWDGTNTNCNISFTINWMKIMLIKKRWWPGTNTECTGFKTISVHVCVAIAILNRIIRRCHTHYFAWSHKLMFTILFIGMTWCTVSVSKMCQGVNLHRNKQNPLQMHIPFKMVCFNTW